MKKILLLLIILTSAILRLQAQNFDDVMIRNKYVTCQDVNFNAAKMIADLYKSNQIDSLYDFLDYWESKCGIVEKIFRLRQLLDIKTANFDNDSISGRSLDYLIAYKPYAPSFFYRYELDRGNDYRQAEKKINTEILSIAASIEQTYTVDEGLIKYFYSTLEPTFTNIKQAPPAESKLRRLYDQRLEETLAMPEYHFGFFMGYYKPFGKIELFGAHPTIGLMFGVKKLRHNFDLVMDVRMGRSKNEYEIVYKGNVLKDDEWTGIYLGLDYTFDIIDTKKFRAGLSPGFGYNGITALEADNDYGDEAKILPSYDANAGIVLKYLFGRAGYIGLHIKYHWVDHYNTGGTELNGNYLTVRLAGGSIYNYDRKRKLKQLE